MENIDIKTIIYFAIAILWFLYSTFRKSQNKTKDQAEVLPPLKDKRIKEIIKDENVPFEDMSNLKKFKEKKKAAFVPVKEKAPFPKNEQYAVDTELLSGVLANVDPRDMVIYSEILKRPVY
ncbi:MAG: hypothetical protein H0X63_11640 [Flavobacteriales bacterium]|nr:hypothetical protein [Flavobacteriales bacterium]